MAIKVNPAEILKQYENLVQRWASTGSKGAASGILGTAKSSLLPIGLTLGAIGLATRGMDKGVSGVKNIISDLRDSLTIDSKIDKIISVQSRLEGADRDKIKIYYQQLRHFAPEVARNDLAAANFIMMALEQHDSGIAIPTYESLSKTQKYLSESKDLIPKGINIAGPALMSASSAHAAGSNIGENTFKPFFPEI